MDTNPNDFAPTILGPGDTPTVPQPSPHPKNSSSAGSTTVIVTTEEMQDLSKDSLLIMAPRTTLNSVTVPCLGCIALVKKLGQGGMAAVYLGFNPRLNKKVAVKVLPMSSVERDSGSKVRFVREAQMAARVESPHLVNVIDVDEDSSGLAFYVMEYVQGISAGDYLKRVRQTGAQGLSELEALDLCIAATVGLAAAHAKEVIHRDVKPDNIMIPGDERKKELRLQHAKLADLGLARDVTEEGITATGVGMGTPGFMSPEQCTDAKKCGKPADVFSMGATLYALLCGKAPFTSDSSAFQVFKDTCDRPHEPILNVRSEVSATTSELLDCCLAKDETIDPRAFKETGERSESLPFPSPTGRGPTSSRIARGVRGVRLWIRAGQ